MRKSAPKIGKGHAPTTYRCKVGGRGRFDKLKALSPRWGSVRAVINWLTRRFESLASTALRPALQALPMQDIACESGREAVRFLPDART